ncbi:MAG: hypothetical protein L6Q76_34320 [Polyangiaceae bacterium]|nr:hypothetical protein [Polyangiaceae bacterium]
MLNGFLRRLYNDMIGKLVTNSRPQLPYLAGLRGGDPRFNAADDALVIILFAQIKPAPGARERGAELRDMLLLSKSIQLFLVGSGADERVVELVPDVVREAVDKRPQGLDEILLVGGDINR